jgi:general secretion pathway protein G
MLKLRKRISSEKGFTLVEIMIVVIILAILAGVALVSFGGLDAKAKDARARADMRAIATALKGYRAMTGAWPAALTPTLTTDALPYTALIDSVPNDPFASAGTPYTYTNPDPDVTDPNGVTISSVGPDGIAGNADDITTVVK